MNEFYNYFSQYIDKDDLADIGFGEITHLVLYRDDRRALVEVMNQKLLTAEMIDRMQKSLAGGLKLSKVEQIGRAHV